MHVIGFVGKKGVGKNFVAELTRRTIKSRLNMSSCSVAFADPIKEYLENVLGIEHGALYGNDFDKEALTEYSWPNMPEWLQAKFNQPSGRVTVRQAMQLFGTELNREVWGKDVWTKALERNLKCRNEEWAMVTDVRFPNEAEVIHKVGGSVWLVSGPQRVKNWRTDAHSSEKLIDNIHCYDYVIHNETDMGPGILEAQIRACLSDMMPIFADQLRS